jgi:hypothetical protein
MGYELQGFAEGLAIAAGSERVKPLPGNSNHPENEPKLSVIYAACKDQVITRTGRVHHRWR